MTERSRVEESEVHHESAYVPREAVQLPKCPNAGFQFHSWGHKNEWRPPSGCDCHPTTSQKMDSGVGLLSCLPLIHLYFKLYHFSGLGIAERQIYSHQWTPNWAPLRLSWDSECVDICKSHTFMSDWKFMHILHFVRIGSEVFFANSTHCCLTDSCFYSHFLQQNGVNPFSTFHSYFSPDASFELFVFCPGLVGCMFEQFPWTF